MTDKLNHHTDPSGLVRAARAVQGQSGLTDILVVDGILRAFTLRVLSRYRQVGRGVITPNDAASADYADCVATAAIFDGETEVYTPVDGWNGAGLAASLRAQMGVPDGTSDRDTISEAFGHFVSHIYDRLRRFGDDEQEDALQEGLSENIRSFAWVLIGMQS